MSQKDDCYKLWIGNLDQKLTEYSFLKVLQNLSISIQKFDFVYNKYGPEKGKSRGYCFVTVGTLQDVDKLIRALDRREIMGKKMVVKPADENRIKTKSFRQKTTKSDHKSYYF